MSGGSFNYVYEKLYTQELAELAGAGYDLDRIADAMAEAGYPEAAAPVCAILGRLRALEAWAIGLSQSGLPELLKAFEWWQSGDWGKDQFEAELAKYLDGRP